MATAEQYQVLSTPAVYVDGQLVKVVPNSVRQPEPGERSVTAVSAGGRSVAHVVGVNAETLKGRVSFALMVTGENVALVEGWSAKANNAEPVTISIISAARTSSYEQMWMTEEPEYSYEAEGQVELTFEGNLPAHT